ncbi:hypothetical protein BJX70DRAFT_367939 [Aspergillus crustosus]
MHYNGSSGYHDLYASMQITRSSALGWTAVGTGSMMAGSLMFIIYGGWGRFYVDMARSINKDTLVPSIPPIRSGVTALGASDIPGGWSWMSPMVHIHGFLMSAAFLILYPAGVFAMRSGSPKAFHSHWILQLIASFFVLVGVAIGLIRAHKISSLHHYIGLIVAVSSIVQIVLGWRHHFLFVQIKRRQWASHGHVWLGRVFLLLGWTNVILGLLLTGRGWKLISLATSFISVVAFALVGWVWFATPQRKHEHRSDCEKDDGFPYALQSTRDDYFAVAADNDDDERESSSSGGISDSVKVRKEDTQ